MNTYPYTCPYIKEPEYRVPQNGTIRDCGFHSHVPRNGTIRHCGFHSHAVNHAEDDRQSTNKNMCNGENSDSRRYCPRCLHFETETVEPKIHVSLGLRYTATCIK